MAVSIGSGLGGFAAIAANSTYGSTFITPTRTIGFKSGKMTWDPHPIQGGPYLRGGKIVDMGSARELIWLDAKGTFTGDVWDVGHALLAATAIGTTDQLVQIGSSGAYALSNGTAGTTTATVYVPLGIPDVNNTSTSGCCFDLQIGAPTADATIHPYNFHSTMITKAEWTFERAGLVTYSYDLDSCYVETSTSLITPSYATGPIPFTTVVAASGTTSAFKAGTYGSEVAVDGVRKATFTLERKMDTARIYLGNQYKDVPISTDVAKITVALEADFTTAANTALFAQFLTGTAISIVAQAVTTQVATGGQYRTFALCAPNCFLDTGGEPNPDGPAIIKNTLTFSGTLDTSYDLNGLGLIFVTADTGF
jgi:hypothetical protein